MLQHELLVKILPKRPIKLPEFESRADSTDSSRQLLSSISKSIAPSNITDRVAVLVVAYHNLGVEMEYLKKVYFSTQT